MADGWQTAWGRFESEAGDVLAQELGLAAPVNKDPHAEAPGTLAGSMSWEDQSGVLTVGSADPRGPIARYVVWGTKPHGIDPVTARALHFFIGDAEVFAQHVDHPGTAPNPFHIEAFKQALPEVLSMFREIMGPAATLAYLNPRRFQQIDI